MYQIFIYFPQRTSGGLHLLWTSILPETEAHGSWQDARQSPRPQSRSHQVKPTGSVRRWWVSKVRAESLRKHNGLNFSPLPSTGSPPRVAQETEVYVWGRWSATAWLVTERACCCWNASWSPATPSRWTCVESVACWDTLGGTFFFYISTTARGHLGWLRNWSTI